MKRTIPINCEPEIQRILVTALRNYTEVAFPEHSSDCAQVARSAMIEAVEQLETQLSREGKGEYNKRLRAMFKEGIKLHFEIAASEDDKNYSEEMALLTRVCEGETATDADLRNARARDGRT